MLFEMMTSVRSYFVAHGSDILMVLALLVVGIWAARLIANASERAMLRSRVNRTLAAFIKNIIYYVIVVFILLSFLEKIGVKTTSFIALIGAAGLAIALALQGSLANFAAGLMIIIFQPFALGDNVETNGVAGVVEDIQIFNTILRTSDHKRKIIPNSKITAEIITVDIKPAR